MNSLNSLPLEDIEGGCVRLEDAINEIEQDFNSYVIRIASSYSYLINLVIDDRFKKRIFLARQRDIFSDMALCGIDPSPFFYTNPIFLIDSFNDDKIESICQFVFSPNHTPSKKDYRKSLEYEPTASMFGSMGNHNIKFNNLRETLKTRGWK